MIRITLQRRMPPGYKITRFSVNGHTTLQRFFGERDRVIPGCLISVQPRSPVYGKLKTVTAVYENDTGLRRFLDRTKKHHSTS